jgi:hypothetical protein
VSPPRLRVSVLILFRALRYLRRLNLALERRSPYISTDTTDEQSAFPHALPISTQRVRLESAHGSTSFSRSTALFPTTNRGRRTRLGNVTRSPGIHAAKTVAAEVADSTLRDRLLNVLPG